jgi:hypothetical protein
LPYFGFVQVELPGELPVDPGRYPLRPAGAGPTAGDPEAVLVITAPQRRPQRRRLLRPRPRPARAQEPAAAPLTSLSVVDARPLEEDPERWLADLRRDAERRDAYVERGLVLIRRALGAARIAAAEPGVGEPTPPALGALRVGFGNGEQVAAGRWEQALELPRDERRARREVLRVGERFAALVSGRERPLAGEELLLRARADLASGREREAVLQAELALRALLAARSSLHASDEELAELETATSALARHAQATPGVAPEPELLAAAEAAVGLAERVLRRRQAQAEPDAERSA